MAEEKKPSMLTEAPKSPEWEGVNLVHALPINFAWRANRYNALKLTKEQIEELAQDKAFGHIVPKEKTVQPSKA